MSLADTLSISAIPAETRLLIQGNSPITLRARCKCDDLNQNHRGHASGRTAAVKNLILFPTSAAAIVHRYRDYSLTFCYRICKHMAVAAKDKCSGLSRLLSIALFYVIPSIYLGLYFNLIPITHVYTAFGRRCGLYCCVVYIHQVFQKIVGL